MKDEKEEEEAAELDGQLEDVDNKVEQLTSSSSSKFEIGSMISQTEMIRKCPGRPWEL